MLENPIGCFDATFPKIGTARRKQCRKIRSEALGWVCVVCLSGFCVKRKEAKEEVSLIALVVLRNATLPSFDSKLQRLLRTLEEVPQRPISASGGGFDLNWIYDDHLSRIAFPLFRTRYPV